MKLKEKLKKTRRNSIIAKALATCAFIYFAMSALKGVYFGTDSSNTILAPEVNYGAKWLIGKSYVFPLSIGWEKIPAIPFKGSHLLEFYKVIIPPAVVVFICAFFISDHRSLREKYYELKAEVEKEIALRDLRRDAGINTVSENATVDVVINNATNSDLFWHNTWWGKVAIGLAIILIAAVFGIK